MRAIALSKFCKPSEYGLATLPVPQIKQPDEVLIKVHAAAINPIDVKMASEFVLYFSNIPSQFVFSRTARLTTHSKIQIRQDDGP